MREEDWRVHLGRLVQGFQGGPLILQPQHLLSEALQLILSCCCLHLSQNILSTTLHAISDWWRPKHWKLISKTCIVSEHSTAYHLPANIPSCIVPVVNSSLVRTYSQLFQLQAEEGVELTAAALQHAMLAGSLLAHVGVSSWTVIAAYQALCSAQTCETVLGAAR